MSRDAFEEMIVRCAAAIADAEAAMIEVDDKNQQIRELDMALSKRDATISSIVAENNRFREELAALRDERDRYKLRAENSVDSKRYEALREELARCQNANNQLAIKTRHAGDVNLRPVVQWFATWMERKLAENAHKGGWNDCTPDELVDRIDKRTTQGRSELEELRRAITSADVEPGAQGWQALQEKVVLEAADIANFAMMIADLHGPRFGQ